MSLDLCIKVVIIVVLGVLWYNKSEKQRVPVRKNDDNDKDGGFPIIYHSFFD